LKEKLRHNAQQLNFMKKTSRAKLMLVWMFLPLIWIIYQLTMLS
jgi:hypothetical protein